MCGIVGAWAHYEVADILLEGLRRMEYRGYDSAGMATIDAKGQMQRQRAEGKVSALADAIARQGLSGHLGVAHTRWATHGKPSTLNAHPLMSSDGTVAVVHNGIIENHSHLRTWLAERGYECESDTDTEVIAHLIHYYLKSDDTFDLRDAVMSTKARLKGAFSLGIMSAREPNRLIGLRQGSPLVVGLSDQATFIASDPMALLSVTQTFVYLEEGDWVDIKGDQVTFYNKSNEAVDRSSHQLACSHSVADRGQHRHYMRKEIYEQPDVLERIARPETLKFLTRTLSTLSLQVKHVQIVACGTSYHAGLVARYWLEERAGLSCQVDIASEYRYRTVAVPENTLFVSLSQSGETADTLAALRKAKTLSYIGTLAVCNVEQSALVRESEYVFLTQAGTEIGVASTKAFTTQLLAMLFLSEVLGGEQATPPIVQALSTLAQDVRKVLTLDASIAQIAKHFAQGHSVLYVGRGTFYPIAMEGALKLKELSYVHAQAYSAGELKHGPLALVDESMWCVGIAARDGLYAKLRSNLEEIRARGGRIMLFADDQLDIEEAPGVNVIRMPLPDGVTAPIVASIPMQLLAYHVAVLKGTDVDQPRNLAKSVTVE